MTISLYLVICFCFFVLSVVNTKIRTKDKLSIGELAAMLIVSFLPGINLVVAFCFFCELLYILCKNDFWDKKIL